MRAPLMLLALAVALNACGGDHTVTPDATPLAPTANPDREITDTKLAFDVTALTASATITLGASTAPGATLEVGDLTIDRVQAAGVDMPFAVAGGKLTLALPSAATPLAVDIAYHWKNHEMFQGASKNGFTLIWPYYCGNLFPCHSQPSDGTPFTLSLTGVPQGKLAVYPTTIPADAPAYQVAWSIDAYTQLDVGTTAAGTLVSVWYRTNANELASATAGTQHLAAAFDWFEKTLGPYRFGKHYGSVSVAWPAGAYGGMEHHPFAHIATAAIANEVTNVHESAHGWFGDGIRIECWEDFVLSEGTVSYLAARALDVVAPSVGAQAWMDYAFSLSNIPGNRLVWPQSCGKIDVLKDNLFTNAPYMRGAFFYKAVADKVGAGLLDQALAAFYMAHAGKTGRMADMLATIKTVTGYDPTACAATWLASTTTPTPGPCP